MHFFLLIWLLAIGYLRSSVSDIPSKFVIRYSLFVIQQSPDNHFPLGYLY